MDERRERRMVQVEEWTVKLGGSEDGQASRLGWPKNTFKMHACFKGLRKINIEHDTSSQRRRTYIQ